MKKNNDKFSENSLRYKLRRWVIIVCGIVQIVHYIFLWIDTKSIFFLISLIFILFNTLLDIKWKFSIGISNPLLIQLLFLAISYGFMYLIFSLKSVVAIIFVEGLLIAIGVYVIYKLYHTRIN